MPFGNQPNSKVPTNEDIMISRRNAFGVALTALLGVAAPALAASGPIARLDTDNDGTVDLDEAKKAAGALFDKLDTDKDGTLDLKESKRSRDRQGVQGGRSRQRWHAEQGRVPCGGRKAV